MSDQAATQNNQFSAKDLFKIRDFTLLWGGQVISSFGDAMTSFALLLLVNELTGSTAALATMAIMLALPTLIFGLIAGVYIDRLDRKKIMIQSDLLRGILVLGFLLVDSADKVWILYLIGFLQATVGTFFTPARSAMLPNIVPKEGLLAANSIAQTSTIIFNLLGLGIAGAIIGIMDGYNTIFLIDSGSFFLSLLLISRIRYRSESTKADEDITAMIVFRELKAGLKITFTNRILLGTITALVVTMLGLGAVNVLLVPLLINDLQIAETWFAAIELGQTSGMIISGAIVAGLAAKFKPRHLLSSGLVGVGITVALISLVGNVWHVIIILFAIGIFVPPVQASAQTIIQTSVPDDLRGRTGSANNALITSAQIGSMAAAGILADAIGTRNVFVVGGVFVVLAGLVSSLIFRGVDLSESEKVLQKLPE